VGETAGCPMEHAHISAKKEAPGSDTAYHRPASCPPSPSWWNILATGAQRDFVVRGNGITPVAELARQPLSSPCCSLLGATIISAATNGPPRRWRGAVVARRDGGRGIPLPNSPEVGDDARMTFRPNALLTIALLPGLARGLQVRRPTGRCVDGDGDCRCDEADFDRE
jgi:hypothetical protein